MHLNWNCRKLIRNYELCAQEFNFCRVAKQQMLLEKWRHRRFPSHWNGHLSSKTRILHLTNEALPHFVTQEWNQSHAFWNIFDCFTYNDWSQATLFCVSRQVIHVVEGVWWDFLNQAAVEAHFVELFLQLGSGSPSVCSQSIQHNYGTMNSQMSPQNSHQHPLSLCQQYSRTTFSK